jgi:hypothetical protein
LSGARDSVTPPAFAQRAAKYMTDHLHVIFPESSHGNFGVCGQNSGRLLRSRIHTGIGRILRFPANTH